MAGFGGAVKLTGESEYRAALRNITSELKLLSAELKLADANFDSNGNAVEDDQKKMEVLSRIISEQKAKIQTLMGAEASLTTKINDQAKAHEQLKGKLETEKQKLADIGKELGTDSKEYKAQEKVVNELSEAVLKSAKNQEANEKELQKVRTELVNAKTELKTTTAEFDKLASAEGSAGDGAEDASTNLKELGKSAEDTGKKAQSSTGGYTVLKQVIADLVTSAIKKAVAGMAELGRKIVEVGKLSLDSYAEYEQLVGGVETLFGAGGATIDQYATSVGKSVDKVQAKYNSLMAGQQTVFKNASEAYKTAGLSANEYMSTVTGFAAALVSSLKGDTEAAAKYADIAVTDMADNANKMGTSMESIQNAYQGFAKQNYTMLDNLKLGRAYYCRAA